MIYLFGNCQMDFLAKELAAYSLPVTYRAQASPITGNSTNGVVPDYLQKHFTTYALDKYTHERTLLNQFSLFSSDDKPPRLIVFNFYHENKPLFAHKEHGHVFFVDPAAWEEHKEFEQWMRDECHIVQPNPAAYLQRFEKQLMRVREQYPRVPILLITRLTHFPAFGPQPYSYLDEWGALSPAALPLYGAWAKALRPFHVLDMDRVFGGIWSRSEQDINVHCPFLRVRLEHANGVPSSLSLERDLEHVGSMWPRMAKKVLEFLKFGRVHYDRDEKVPATWLQTPFSPSPIDDAPLQQLLGSGSNYDVARAVGAFYWNLGRDYTGMLSEYGANTPVCHNTLHMIDNYGQIHKNPELANWCKAHRPKVMEFDQNGVLFQQQYLERITKIEQRAEQIQ